MNKFTVPGVMIHDTMSRNFPTFKFHEEPPPGCEVDYDIFNDPFPGETIAEIGIDRLVDDLSINYDPETMRLHFDFHGFWATRLNKKQGYFILCNVMWALQMFVGDRVDYSLNHKMEAVAGQVIASLAQVEMAPGEFGQVSDPRDKVRASDFDLEEYE